MEQAPNFEAEKQPNIYSKPPIEVFNDPAETEMVWANPELTKQVRKRSELAKNISEYFADEKNEAQEEQYFEAGAELLSDPDNYRLALYWPQENLDHATSDFRDAYMDAWQRMLFVEDVREIYNEADIPEKSARAEDPERVVKAAHLLPWLMKADFISSDDIVGLIENTDDPVLKKSILDTRGVLEDWGLADEAMIGAFDRVAAELPQGEKAEPLYVSDARKAWLESKDNHEDIGVAEMQLMGPFSENAKYIEDKIEEIKNDLPDGALAFVGGSRLKGYGSENSDLDVHLWGGADGADEFSQKYDAEILPESFDANPELAHILFDTLWVGDEAVAQKARQDLMLPYMELPEGVDRDWSQERIELDLLVFRLMHKGIKRKYDDVSENTKQYNDMDGASAFYDERYRKIATELFAKYVFIPKI